ncbi:hypothetical protein NO995_06765 [Aestuariibaculum sp. M13]|uniref:hypothetical protein n=1 Tax=Aestuariibaculum sp. M13 TaxID=2967132 RepID=UPI00215A0413|nr:hypothetical protein [Aestuariibaculum sp. M13]MCR8667374.1 hypothetical protein [Aestuariibaculum sp. M13]
MKIFSLFLGLFILLSCNSDSDENGIDCSSITIVPPSILLKITNLTGDNLIEKETYISNNITIEFNNDLYKNVVNQNFENFKNLINIPLYGTDMEREYKINLSETETDILNLNVSFKEGACGIKIATPNSATYNGNTVTIEDYNNNYLITVVK